MNERVNNKTVSCSSLILATFFSEVLIYKELMLHYYVWLTVKRTPFVYYYNLQTTVFKYLFIKKFKNKLYYMNIHKFEASVV